MTKEDYRSITIDVGTHLLIVINYVADLEKRITELEAELAKKRKKR